MAWAWRGLSLVLALLSPSGRLSLAASIACPTSNDPLARATRPVITPAPPGACPADSMAIYFPSTETAASCVTEGDRECVRGDGCAVQCIPRIGRNTGWFLSLVTDTAVVDEVATWNMVRPGAMTITINASLVSSWVDGIKPLPTYLLTSSYGQLSIAGNEAANDNLGSPGQENKFVTPGMVVPFVLPASFFTSVKDVYKLTLENLNVTIPAAGADANLKFLILDTLTLRNTLLTSFPLPLTAFPFLTTVDLSANFLTKVTKWGFPDGLIYFNVSMNQIRSIEKGALPKQLKTLDLSGNPLTTIPRDTLPPTLFSLFLAATNMAKMPADIANMTRLRELSLSDNSLDGRLFDTVVLNDGLLILHMANCSLTSIPSAFRNSKLETIDFDHNDFSIEPDFSHLPPSVIVLRMSSCRLRKIPSDLLGFTNLTQLVLSNNPQAMANLSMLPTSLQSLVLDANALESVPRRIQSLGRLQKLQMLRNQLKQLAQDDLPRTLTDLSLSEASFRAVQSNTLPVSLTRLAIENSGLEIVPDDIRALSNLKSLDITGCRLVSFAFSEVLPTLDQIDLRNNTLTTFSAQMPVVTSIDLSRNVLRDFNLAGNALLQSLSLADNNLTTVPPAVFRFPMLKTLNLSQNPIRNFSPTAVELKFLSQIPTVVFDQAMFASHCKTPKTLSLHGFQVCDPGTGVAPSSRAKTTVIVISLLGVLTAAAVAVAVWHRRTLHKTQQQDRANESARREKRQLHEATASVWSDPLLLQHRLDVQHIHAVRQLGSSAVGDVWLASYLHEYVAVKTLKPSSAAVTVKRTLDFADEVRLSLSLSHPRILSAVGVLWTTVGDLSLITEYMAGGNLQTYLATMASPWTSVQTQIALDITEALVYLHSLDPIAIHGRLHSRNVLLDMEMRPKIGDVGVAPSMYEDGAAIALNSGGWIAPEIRRAEPHDESADIYSLGVLLSELSTHAQPLADGSGSCEFVACPSENRTLAERCVSIDPFNRPSSLQIAYELRLLLSTEQGPDLYER